MEKPKSSVYSLEKTVGDTATPITEYPLPFYTCNIHVYDKAIYYGSGALQVGKAVADSTIDFQYGDLNDIFVKNETAGQTATLGVVMTIPVAEIKQALGALTVGV